MLYQLKRLKCVTIILAFDYQRDRILNFVIIVLSRVFFLGPYVIIYPTCMVLISAVGLEGGNFIYFLILILDKRSIYLNESLNYQLISSYYNFHLRAIDVLCKYDDDLLQENIQSISNCSQNNFQMLTCVTYIIDNFLFIICDHNM